MRICIVGDDNDLSAAYIAWRAKQRGAEVVELPEQQYGITWTFRLEPEVSRSVLTVDARSLCLDEVDGAFVRLNPKPVIPEALDIPNELEHIYALERRYGLHYFLDEAPFPVINRPHAGRSNSSKPFQMTWLEDARFAVPPWVVTNDPAVAREFASVAGGAIYKASSGLRSHVRRVDDAFLERLEAGSAPVVVQHYVHGNDVRVHVVGNRTFGSRVCSDAVDYRFDSDSNDYISVEVPREISELCVETAARDGLALAGLDFRLDDDGRWWCLELNPVPTFLPYEAGTGQPIGDAILDLFGALSKPGPSVSPLFQLAEREP